MYGLVGHHIPYRTASNGNSLWRIVFELTWSELARGSVGCRSGSQLIAGTALELADAGADLRIHDGVADLDIVDFTGWLTNTGTPAASQFVGITDLSTQLDDGQQSFNSNDSGARWCVPSAPTPGAGNGSCTTPLAINEVMVNAFGSDDDNEFVELRGVPGAHLENARVRSTDADGVPTGLDISAVFGIRVPLDGLFVLADDTGGTTAVANADAVASLGNLPDGPGALQVIVGAGVNDAVGYGTLNVAVDTVDGFAIVETASTSFAEGSSIARDAVGTDNDDNASDFHLDPSPTPGVENDLVAVTITSVSPDDGLATATVSTTITGDEFVVGAVVLVNGVLAACTVTSATNIGCSFPSNGGTVELVDVSVTNPSVGAQTLVDGFTYTGVLSDPGAAFYCNVQSPPSTTTTVGVATEDIFGQIYIMGMTDTQGTPVAGIDCDLGYGPDGSDVTLVNFNWSAAAPNGGYDFGQNNDEHVSTLTVGATGTYDYAYRFSTDGGLNYYYCDTGAGSDDGYSAAAAGSLTVN